MDSMRIETTRAVYAKGSRVVGKLDPGNLTRIIITAYKHVVIMAFLVFTVFASVVYGQGYTHEVNGQVTDETGAPLPGATVLVQNTEHGTSTDIDGYYTLFVDENSILIVSYIGYQTQIIDVGGREKIDVELVVVSGSLDELVVIGYGAQRRATLTGAVADAPGEKLRQVPVLNVSNSLAGRVPGLVTITQSGEPGLDNSTIRVRGTNTLGNNNPLIVVDGISNRSLNRLNPDDIESITVLKDASAAIYGAQAANGVILVTTKRGDMSPAMINITLDRGWGQFTRLPEMADAPAYARALNELQTGSGGTPVYTEQQIQRFADGSDPWAYPNNNNFDLVLRNFAPQYHLNSSISGGTENLSYYFSGGYRYQDAIYKNSSTDFSQVDFRSNVDYQITDNFTVSLDLAGSQRTENQPNEEKDRVMQFLYRGIPTWPTVWPDGSPGPAQEFGSNPVIVTTGESGYKRDTRYEFLSNLRLKMEIPWVTGLSITGNASVDKFFTEGTHWNQPWTLYNWDGQTYNEHGEPVLVAGQYAARGHGTDPNLQKINRLGESVTLNALVNYERTFHNKHNIGVLLGSERNTGISNELMAFRRYFSSSVLDELFAGGDAEKDNFGMANEEARLNFFGRINYDYNWKYLLELVFRYDGSYIFPKEGRFGFFPGVSLGWNISEEDFWKDNITFINYFKIRGSIGQTGNDRIEPYQYLASYGFVRTTAGDAMGDTYIFGENIENKTLGELRIPNPNVTWEVATQSNIGLDGSISNFNFSFDYFYNLRRDILLFRSASVPQSTGLTLPRENIGEVVNRGMEAAIRYDSHRQGDFLYSLSFNMGYQKNYVKFMDEEPGAPDYQQATGMPIGAPLLYEVIGVFRDEEHLNSYPHWDGARPGDLIYKDVNGDGVIDGDDRIRQEKTNIPTLTAGLSIDLEYKNFYTTALVQGAAGAERTRSQRVGFAGNYYMQDLRGRWTPDNLNATKPRVWDEGVYWNSGNTYWRENNDYLRLKSIEIGYTIHNIPGMNSIRLYLSGLNLLTLTNLRDFDPESVGEIHYPQNRIYNFGISLNL